MKPVIKLDARTSAQTIQRAVRCHSQIVIEPEGLAQTTINGYLLSGDDKALLMEVTGRPMIDFATLINSACAVQIYSDQRYIFETKITDAPQWGESRSLALLRPKTLRVLDRRRFIRAKLASSSRVTLEWERADSTHRHIATLLNISVDGLACRIDGGAAAIMDVGRELRSIFRLPADNRQFELEATVTNRTPASEGCVILGLQFVVSGRAARQLSELRECLREAPHSPSPSGLPA